MILNKLLKPYRLVSGTRKVVLDLSCLLKYPQHFQSKQIYVTDTRIMAQRSITSFFKITPPKNTADKEGNVKNKECNLHGEESSSVNGGEKNTSKRPRLESSESETEILKSPQVTSEKKKKVKRQRIESTDSESDSIKSPGQKSRSPDQKTIKEEKVDSGTEVEENVKVEKENNPKTYDSPKSKKRKSNSSSKTTKFNSPKQKDTKKDVPVKKESNTNSPKLKESKSGSEKKGTKTKSPKEKEAKETSSSKKESKLDSSIEKDSPKRSPSPKSKTKVKKEVVNGNGETPEKNKENIKVKQEDDKDQSVEKVPETEYNPAKSKYHPIEDACWSASQPVPYLALARTLEAIEVTSARLKIIEILANYFRSVIALTPEDLLPSVYMCLNKLAPAYHSLELGIAETYLMKAVGQCTGRTVPQVRAAAQRAGDLGTAAAAARATQRTMFTPANLTLRKVFAALKEVAHMTGHASVNKKISKIQTLFVACRHSEAKFLIRSLEGKLRIGLAEQSVLQALAVATTLTPPDPAGVKLLDASKGLSTEAFKSKVDANALIIKTTYCECPNYDLVIPALLQHGVAALPEHCRLTVGIPLKPMLAHPTKGVHEVFNRFEGCEFTCEWKYDGERAQIHVPGTDAAHLEKAAIFSRNQENNTSKYPDILRRLPSLLKASVVNCVLDCEAVAYDTVNKQILPFQILSTRKRKDASEEDIKVQVCVYVFDLLYLNGRALVREPLHTRRELLREHFNELEGAWQFASSRDCSSMEEVQQFLEESVKGSCEGLMVKTLSGDHAKYDIARRSHNWLKLKKDYLEGVGDTIDVVIIGAYWGRGKRHRTYGGFLAAAREPHCDKYQALCKLGTGFTDDDLQTLTKELDKHRIEAPRSYYSYDNSHSPDVWFDAVCVWEVRCADLSLSPSHRAAIGLVDPDKGISLRFPRFIRVRADKPAEAATSAQQIAEMYLAQDQVKNNTTKPNVNYDDFY